MARRLQISAPSFQNPHSASQNTQNTINQPTNGSHDTIPAPDDDEDSFKGVMIIKTPLNITGNCNLVAIDSSASSVHITSTIAEAACDISTYDDGIPMIDARGCLRALTIFVDAPMNIHGTKNIIGEKAVMKMVENDIEKNAGTRGGNRGNRELHSSS
jgi:hypothetical protein